MSWVKVTFPLSECGVGGKSERLKDAFTDVFIANHSPADAAMFFQRSEDLEKGYFYFSPGATLIARSIIEPYGSVPCEAPLEGTVRLYVGSDDAPRTLLPTSP